MFKKSNWHCFVFWMNKLTLFIKLYLCWLPMWPKEIDLLKLLQIFSPKWEHPIKGDAFYLQARVEPLAGKYLKEGCDFLNTSASWKGLLKAMAVVEKTYFLAWMFKKPSLECSLARIIWRSSPWPLYSQTFSNIPISQWAILTSSSN